MAKAVVRRATLLSAAGVVAGRNAVEESASNAAPRKIDLESSARPGSKTARIIDLLQRPGGATLKELMRAVGWQPHSVRGFLSGTVSKKMGLRVKSFKRDGQRVYRIVKK